MVLVDTSVLIDFFRNKCNEGTKKLESLVKSGTKFGISNIIYLEILQGAASKKDFDLLKTYLGTQNFYDLKNGRDSHSAAAEMYRKCREAGITVGTIDLLIVQTTLENNLSLLHNDRDYIMVQNVVPELKFH
jgi:predicted nucleic acid-binding protein